MCVCVCVCVCVYVRLWALHLSECACMCTSSQFVPARRGRGIRCLIRRPSLGTVAPAQGPHPRYLAISATPEPPVRNVYAITTCSGVEKERDTEGLHLLGLCLGLIKDGTASLKDGTASLTDGTASLKDGSASLKDGRIVEATNSEMGS